MAAVEVVIYQQPNHPRSRVVCAAMLEGIRAAGDAPRLRASVAYRKPEAPVAVFYGLTPPLAAALRDYPAAGETAVYVDLGYWGRKDGGRFAGFHKLSVNSRHPTAYFQQRPHTDSRAMVFNLKAQAWRRAGEHILLVGMGPKGAAAEGYKPLGWEAQALAHLRQHTTRPVIYRPKPNWERPPPLDGARQSRPGMSLLHDLTGCHAVVTHHSNAAIEAIAAGVPAFVVEGAAMPMALSDLAAIDTPAMPATAARRQWLHDLAWTQFSIAEIARGVAWRHLKDEGLVP